MANVGKIKQIIGAVVDVQFDGTLPEIYNALELKRKMAIHLFLRCNSTLVRTVFAPLRWMVPKGWCVGTEVTDTGKAIAMPIGEGIKGRLFNVTGDPIDGLPAVSKENGRPIHAKPPLFENLSTAYRSSVYRY